MAGSAITKTPTYVSSFHGDKINKGLQYRTLGNTDMLVSYIGFGASSLGSVFRVTDDDEAIECVQLALRSGINYIDTAPWYGQGKSEEVLGRALRSVPRSAYYIATKVGRYSLDPKAMFDFSYERVLSSIDESLQRLGLDYVDLIQVHDVEFAPNEEIILGQTLPALQKLKLEGKTRYIGITGYPLSVLANLVERSTVRIDTVLTYCRYSMNDSSLLNYLDFFSKNGIGIINASPLSMGLLTARGPPSWHPAIAACPGVISACQEAAKYCTEKGCDLSRLALRFSLDLEDCATCLISTASPENMLRNIETATEPMTAKEKECMSHVMATYMKPLNSSHWEGIEVAKHRQAIASQFTV